MRILVISPKQLPIPPITGGSVESGMRKVRLLSKKSSMSRFTGMW
ncbi:hypothetical protein ACFYU8_10055 [Brevibacillus sp. NPDC003359]